jgi:hypothetical protein
VWPIWKSKDKAKASKYGIHSSPADYLSAALRAERNLRLYFESKGYKVEGGKDLLKTK